MRKILLAAATAAVFAPATALATDGYFSHGYGMKSKGRGSDNFFIPEFGYNKIPSNFNIGLAFTVNPKLTLAAN